MTVVVTTKSVICTWKLDRMNFPTNWAMNACVPTNCKYIDKFNGLAIISFFTCICMWHVNVVSVFVSELYFDCMDANWSDLKESQWFWIVPMAQQVRARQNVVQSTNNSQQPQSLSLCLFIYMCRDTVCVDILAVSECVWIFFHFIIADRPLIANCRWVGRRRVHIVSHRWMCACLCMSLVVNYYSQLRS